MRGQYVELCFAEACAPACVHYQPCSNEDLELKGLNSLDNDAARLIRKLMVKDPHERWTSLKCLNSSFFRSMEDTARIQTSHTQVTFWVTCGIAFTGQQYM